MEISDIEKRIYQRQIMIDGWGMAGQERLKEATVFIAGAGGLGSPAAIYLAVAGVGRLRICDFDSPDWSNLNRQILHDPSRIGMNKAYSARKTLERMTGQVQIADLRQKITAENVDALVGDAALIVDCMDNVETRFVLNAAALRRRIPLIHGSVRGLEGRLSFFFPPGTPCLRCLIEEPPPAETFPIVGAVPGLIGTLQALEAIKYLTGVGRPLAGKLLVWDGQYAEFTTLTLKRNPACPACSPLYGERLARLLKTPYAHL